jgi:uncharacterized protein
MNQPQPQNSDPSNVLSKDRSNSFSDIVATADVAIPGSGSAPMVPPLLPVQHARPRLWSVFSATGLAFASLFALSILATIPFVLMEIVNSKGNVSEASLMSKLTTPWAIYLQMLAGQIGLMAVTIAAAWYSPIPFAERLGMRRSRLTTSHWICIGFGSFVPAAVGLVFASWVSMVFSADNSLAKVFAEMPSALLIPWVLTIAFLPGFGEEMLFRGYLQRRLLERWRPWQAIGTTSALFALIHLMLHTVVFAFPIGIWFGFVAWKTGTIWPTVLGHILINGSWNLLHLSKSVMGYSDTVSNVLLGVLALLGLLCFAIALPVLLRSDWHATSTTVEDTQPVRL